MIAAANAPDAALMRWVRSIPAVHCVAPAFRAWTRAKDGPVVPVTSVPGKRFAETAFAGAVVPGSAAMAGSGDLANYAVARVPSVPAVVLQFSGGGGEDYFAAVVAERSPPPHAVAALSAAPRTKHRLGLGSPRAAVEAALGAGRAKTLCGFDVVRYEQAEPRATVAEMWFFYRGGVVAAITRYEAV